jgi:glycosyltransferase involved in cell wall biosynthesis
MNMNICLNMIVKDEGQRIGRCLDSVLPFINAWVICDTGSKDNTRKLVGDRLADLPGALYEEPWKDFEMNRNSALAHAKTFAGPDGYILFMDADDWIVNEGMDLYIGAASCYDIEEHDQNLRFWRPFIVRANLPWRWIGKTHECLTLDGEALPASRQRIMGMYRQRGGKRPGQILAKLGRDVGLLLEAVAIAPNDARSRFYLAQTYKDMGRREAALDSYERRIQMPGDLEEHWWAHYEAAILRELLHRPTELILMSYLSCYELRPTRAEPLWQAARFCRVGGMYHAGLIFAERGLRIPRPVDSLFIDEEIYRWKMLDEYSICAYWTGLHEVCLDACRELLDGRAPEGETDRIKRNMSHAADQMRARGIWQRHEGDRPMPKLELQGPVESNTAGESGLSENKPMAQCATDTVERGQINRISHD